MPPKTTDLCDACESAFVCLLQFRGFGRRRAFSGPISTVRGQDVLGSLRDALSSPGEGRVLVIDGGAAPGYALFGDLMAARARDNGWNGVVVNGLIRDSVEIDTMDLGVRALGTVPRRPPGRGHGERDVPVVFGGVTFTPGDWIVADDDGVIVLPSGLTERDIPTADVVAATAAYAEGR